MASSARLLLLLQRAHGPERLGIGHLRVGEHLARRRLFDHLAIAQHHDPVGHLGHDGKIVGDVDGRGIGLAHHVLDRRQHLDLGRHVESRGRFVEDQQVGMAGHRHGGHGALKLAAGHLMGIAAADRFRRGQAQPAEQFDRLVLGVRLAQDVMPCRRLDILVHQPVGRIERGGGRLGHIGNPPPPYFALVRRAQLQKVDAIEHDGAGGNAAAGPGIAHGGKADGRFAGTGFADQAEHLAAPQRQIDALDDGHPDVVALPLDLEPLDLEQQIASLAGLVLTRGAHSFSPLVLCRNQSTTKLIATVSSAIAAAGSSGVISP